MPARRLMAGLLALLCAAWLVEGGTRVRAGERQTLHGHVPAAVGGLPALERLAGTNRLNLVIGLPLRNRAALTSLLGQLYDPASPAYHQYLTPGAFAERFGPTPQDYEAVITFAKANGLRVTGTHPNRTLVDVSGAAGDIEKTFQVKLHVYQHPTEGRTFYAPDAEPSLDLAVPVLGVSGLDNFEVPRPASPARLVLPQGFDGDVRRSPWWRARAQEGLSWGGISARPMRRGWRWTAPGKRWGCWSLMATTRVTCWLTRTWPGCRTSP